MAAPIGRRSAWSKDPRQLAIVERPTAQDAQPSQVSEESNAKTNPTLKKEGQCWSDEADRSQLTISGRTESRREESERQVLNLDDEPGTTLLLKISELIGIL